MYEVMKRRLLHVFQINLPLFASHKIPGVPGLAVPFPGVMPEQLDFFMNPFYMIHRIIKLSLNLTVFFSVQLFGRGLFFYQECNQPYEGVQDPGRSPRGPVIRGEGKGGCLQYSFWLSRKLRKREWASLDSALTVPLHLAEAPTQ